MDIDCRRYNYETKVNPIIKEAAEKAGEVANKTNTSLVRSIENTRESVLENLFQSTSYNTVAQSVDNYNKTDSKRTEIIEESLQKSMLKFIKKDKLDKEILEGAFCRDIDSFNSAFVVIFNPKIICILQKNHIEYVHVSFVQYL